MQSVVLFVFNMKVAVLFLGLVAVAAAKLTVRHPKVTPNVNALPFNKLVEETYKPSVFIPGYKTVANCGKNKYYGQESRIVGGVEAEPHTWPWQVYLTFNDRWLCGGSIISDEYILTAAHCTQGADKVEVLAGAHNIRQDEPSQVTFISTEITTHEDYGGLFLRNDIGLIRIAEGITFTPEIQPVCLPTRSDVELVEGDVVTPTGWGLSSDDASFTSSTLNQVTVNVTSNEKCSAVYGNTITEDIVCISSEGGHGTCSGDSGGPLNYDKDGSGVYCTRGVTSFGSSTGCETGYPDGFTRVTHYLDWIETNTGIIIG